MERARKNRYKGKWQLLSSCLKGRAGVVALCAHDFARWSDGINVAGGIWRGKDRKSEGMLRAFHLDVMGCGKEAGKSKQRHMRGDRLRLRGRKALVVGRKTCPTL